jgi:hypothetical protein
LTRGQSFFTSRSFRSKNFLMSPIMTIFKNRTETLREETPTVKANRRHGWNQKKKMPRTTR